MGEMDFARNELEDQLGQATVAGDEGSQAQLSSFLGIIDMRTGRWSRATDRFEAAVRLSDMMEFTQGAAEKRGWLALLQAHQGRLEVARRNIDDGLAVSTAIGDRIGEVIHLSARALIEFSLAEPARVLEHTARIRELLLPAHDVPVWLDFEGDEIDAMIETGRISEAAERLLHLQERAEREPRRRLRAWVARGQSLLLAAQGDIAGALAITEALLAEDDLTPDPYEHARTLLLKGQLLRRCKQKAYSRDALTDACAIFDRLGAGIWAAKTRAEIARLGLRRAGEELTETEQRVAELAAAGKTNRQIAAELFISRRTVEDNLARAYRKLGVNNRAALARRLPTTQPHGPAAPAPSNSQEPPPP